MAQLFKKNILIEKLENFIIPNSDEKIEILKKWNNLYQNQILKTKKEEELEAPFWDEIFWKVLDYNSITENDIYNRKFQPKVPEWWQKADIGLWFFGSENEIMQVIIELKDSNTSLDKPQQRAWNLTPVQQAFKYKPYFKECDFVIVSNFYETRLYIDNYYDFEVWTLTDLVNPKDNYFNFRKFYYLLSKENLIAEKWESNTKSLISVIRIQEKEITKKFYSEYSLLRKELFKDIVVNNNIKKSELDFILNKTQKIIDRIIFIHFCEDLWLLPAWKLKENLLRAEEIGFSPWEMLKKFFEFVNSWSERLGIPNGYNGWLFKEDKELNQIKIWNDICKKFVNLWDYDFANDLSVNILGHIFEQSISDIEEIKDQLSKDEDIEKTSKRKKDGIFYTPEYIVDYIVKNSVGKKIDEWEEELKEKHNLKEEITDKNYTKRAILVYEELKEKVENIKVLDPACWSGAFLVKVFDFLLDKNKEIANKLQDLWINQGLFSSESYFKTILQNNIYWVDLNEESVEITKLGLWLKTAQKGKKLANLDKNIKCGNSLIDDENIAWNKAFKWEEEFSDIFKQGVASPCSQKKAFHITWVTHNSRVSERMIQYKVEKWEWVYFDEKQEVLITWYIRDIVKEDNLKVLAYNICKDHIHMLLVCEENDLSNIIRKIKWKSSQKYKQYLRIDKDESFSLWAQKYNNSYIETDEKFTEVINYIENNRIKHELPLNKGLQPLVQEMLCSYDEAFDISTSWNRWWFDVIVWNPPYGANLDELSKEYCKKTYENVHTRTIETFNYFISKSQSILKNGWFLAFIVPNNLLFQNEYEKTRLFLLEQNQIYLLINLWDSVFEDATVPSCMFFIKKEKTKEYKINYWDVRFTEQKNNLNTSEEYLNNEIKKNPWTIFWINPKISKIIWKVAKKSYLVDEIAEEMASWISTWWDKIFRIDENIVKNYSLEKDLLKKCLVWWNIWKYSIDFQWDLLIYTNREVKIDNFPNTKNYLEQFKEQLSQKRETKKWMIPYWSLHWPRYKELFEDEKIILRQTSDSIIATYDKDGFYVLNSILVLKIDKKYQNIDYKFVISILNSKLNNFIYKNFTQEEGRVFAEVKPINVRKLFIPNISLPAQQPFIEKTDKMLELNKSLQPLIQKFLNRLRSTFWIEKFSGKLEKFYELEFWDFVKELSKMNVSCEHGIVPEQGVATPCSKEVYPCSKKVKLSLKEQDAWEDYFDSYKKEILDLKSQINTCDKEIDEMVFDLYWLDEEERKVVLGK